MRITTRSAIDVSESLATFLLASHLYHEKGVNPQFEKRLKYVDTGKFSVADIYLPTENCSIEMKSTAHGNDALKGVLQASVYKEQCDQAIFCIQKPKRRPLRESLESMCLTYGVGLIYITSIPTICSESTIKRATGGCTKPFELWRGRRYASTRNRIISKSRTGWIREYMDTLEQVIQSESESLFDFKIRPDSSVPGLKRVHNQ